jgi:hypothetical protein
MMKGFRVWIFLLLLGFGWPVFSRGWTTEHVLVDGEVSVTNTQKNSAWVPVAVMVRFEEPTSGQIKVIRENNGRRYTLGICVFTDAVSVVWVPDTAYSFTKGDTLWVESNIPEGVVQLIRKGE